MEFHHYSVLLNETIENLNIRPDGIYVDGTLGGGRTFLPDIKASGREWKLIGIDQDADAIQAAGERLAEFGNKATLNPQQLCQYERRTACDRSERGRWHSA